MSKKTYNLMSFALIILCVSVSVDAFYTGAMGTPLLESKSFLTGISLVGVLSMMLFAIRKNFKI